MIHHLNYVGRRVEFINVIKPNTMVGIGVLIWISTANLRKIYRLKVGHSIGMFSWRITGGTPGHHQRRHAFVG